MKGYDVCVILHLLMVLCILFHDIDISYTLMILFGSTLVQWSGDEMGGWIGTKCATMTTHGVIFRFA